MEYVLLISFAVSFLVAYLLMPPWIRAAKRAGLVGKDMNKFFKPEVAEVGGIAAVAGFISGVLIYVAISTFYFHSNPYLTFILAVVATVLLATLVGIIDDVLGWKVGLKQWHKPLLTLPAALPLMVVNAGESAMELPFFGSVDFGVLYPLVIIPLAVTGAANGFNMLAGYNGLEAGMGIIILGTMGIVAWQTKVSWVAVLAFCMVFALLAFLRYNWFPAKVFPGNIMTYSVGALLACVAILANQEKIALLLFLPYFADFFLPLRKKMKVEAFAKPNADNSLEMPYEKIYDMAHFAIFALKKIKSKVYETDVVLFIFSLEGLLAALALVIRW